MNKLRRIWESNFLRKLRINPVAEQDLYDVKEYIAKELDNPTAAVDVISNIMGCYGKLRNFRCWELNYRPELMYQQIIGICFVETTLFFTKMMMFMYLFIGFYIQDGIM